MYETFYKLREKPFTLLPDPGFLFLSNKHRMALTLLEYGLMNHAGFTVISGDIGAGKTTLIRHLLDHMDREHTVGLITNTHSSFGELLQWILLAFNLEHTNLDKVGMYRRFVDFIIDEYAHNRRVVLIVDEAQNMAAETLEELRMLSNVNADKDQALQVILVGQRELRDTLRRPDLVQFAQRISVDYHLEPLSEEETVDYIRHRLEIAGGNPTLFEEDACRAVYRYSNGVPRLINLLCDTALVYGYAEQQEQIDSALVTDVAREKQQGGIFPTFHPATPVEKTRTRPDPATEDTGPDAETGTLHEVERAKTGPSLESKAEPHPIANRNTPGTTRVEPVHEAATDPDIEAADRGPATQPTSVSAVDPRLNTAKKKVPI
jgi:general secretion pathway protein A